MRFGFREFWIDGRDFYLNGTRIYLSSVPLDNAQLGAAWATYDRALDTMKRLQSIGINYVYTHNYSCDARLAPGLRRHPARGRRRRHARRASRMPHFGHYDWNAPDADKTNGYARTAAFYVRVAEDHPSVVFYPMSHNSTGYADENNPDMIDGIHAPRPHTWAHAERGRRRCGRRRSSTTWTPRASSTTTPAATSATCTPSTSTPTSSHRRSWTTGSSTGPPRA